MLQEVEGFILTETPYGETSKIINVLTKEYGIIGIMCNGAKSRPAEDLWGGAGVHPFCSGSLKSKIQPENNMPIDIVGRCK